MKAILSVDPVKFPLTGIGRYTYELGLGLQRQSLESLKFLKGYHLSSVLPQATDEKPMSAQARWKNWAQQSDFVVSAYRRINPWLKSRALKGHADHVFHGPNYYLPPFSGRSVVTIHDLSHYVWTHGHPKERVKYMQAEMELSLQRASAIITDSEYTKKEVVNHFGWPTSRVIAVHLGCGPEFHPRTGEELRPCLEALGLAAGGYCLFSGTIEPRKNIGLLVEAYRRLPSRVRSRWPLVVTGYRGWKSDDLHQSLADAQSEGWLKYLGFVPHNTLPLLLAGARLFLYPSHYEGFGLPVLEAMASGVPVICSNATSLPEVSGGVAAMHNPNDVDALFMLLQMGLEDEAWRSAASHAGQVRAQEFTWNQCARETLAVYVRVSMGEFQ